MFKVQHIWQEMALFAHNSLDYAARDENFRYEFGARTFHNQLNETLLGVYNI